MVGDTNVVQANIIVVDVVVNVDDTDIRVVWSLVNHDSRGLFSFGLK